MFHVAHWVSEWVRVKKQETRTIYGLGPKQEIHLKEWLKKKKSSSKSKSEGAELNPAWVKVKVCRLQAHESSRAESSTGTFPTSA